MGRLLLLLILFGPLSHGVDTSSRRAIDHSGYDLYKNTDEPICKTCDCWARLSNRRLKLDCSNRSLTGLPKLNNTWNVIELDLSHNNLDNGPDLTDKSYDSLIMLDLSHNFIHTVGFHLFSPMLTALYLNNNYLTSIYRKITAYINSGSKIENITLAGNPWNCHCNNDTIELAKFVKYAKKQYSDFQDATCIRSEEKLINLDTKALCEIGNKWLLPAVTIVVCFLILGSVLGIYYLTTRNMVLRQRAARAAQTANMQMNRMPHNPMP